MKFKTPSKSTVYDSFFAIFVVISIACVSHLLALNFPRPGLDHSWTFSVNEAVAQGLIFGKEFIFTFGPYSSLYTALYHPATDKLMLVSGGIFFTALTLSLLLLYGNKGRYPLLALCVFLTAYSFIDALLFFLPFCLTLLIAKYFPADKETENKKTLALKKGVLIFLFSTLGLLPLIKTSVTPICLATLFLSAVYVAFRREYFFACSLILAPLIMMAFLWEFSGQDLSNLLTFIKSTTYIVSGYTEAMSIYGRNEEVILYIAACFWGGGIFLTSEKNWKKKIFILLNAGLFLFLSFKAGFTRHDGHALIAACSIVIAGLTLCALYNTLRVKIWALGCLGTWFFIANTYESVSPKSFAERIFNKYIHSWEVATKRASESSIIDDQYLDAIEKIYTEKPLIKLPGTSDIYSFQQSYLLASGNKWKPRPIIQSYSAYTPDLAKINRDFLAREGAENIFYNVEPIDGRFPSLEDGASLPILLTGYRLVAHEQGLLRFKRKSKSEIHPVTNQVFELKGARFDQEIKLPNSLSNIFAEIEIKQSAWGNLASFFFKPEPLHIVVVARDGREFSYRYVTSMGKSTFLLSPLIRSNLDIILLAGSETQHPDFQSIKSFKIIGAIGWEDHFRVKFINYTLPKSGQELIKYNELQAIEISDTSRRLVDCTGVIDSLNHMVPPPNKALTGRLRVEGWLLDANGWDGDLEKYVYLTDELGRNYFYSVEKTSRDDVKTHFGNPKMPNPGYVSIFNTEKLEGNYRLGLARKSGDSLEICKNLEIDLNFHK